MKFIKIALITIISFWGMFSCITQKDYVILKKNALYDSTYIPKYTPYIVQPNDILSITVSSTDPETSMIFTKQASGNANINASMTEMGSYMRGFSLNDSGNITLPIIGQVKALGLTLDALTDTLQQKINLYFKFSVVDVKLANFRLTFMGEFSHQGPILVYRNRINLIEALALSGGFNDFAKRKSVTIYRNINGQTHIKTVDFTSVDLIHHEWFYLMPNDVLYAEPVRIKTLKVNSGTISFISSFVSLGVLIISLAYRYR